MQLNADHHADLAVPQVYAQLLDQGPPCVLLQMNRFAKPRIAAEFELLQQPKLRDLERPRPLRQHPLARR